jgi:hypothetical protein
MANYLAKRGDYLQYPIASDYEEITVSTTAVGLNPMKARASLAAIISVVSQPIRVRFDGVDPTATTGVKMTDGDTFDLGPMLNLIHFRAIRDTSAGGDATLYVQYFK